MAASPLSPGAVACESRQKPEQADARTTRDHHRRGRAEQRSHALGQHGRFRQGCGEPGGQPAGVAPRRPRRDVVAFQHGDVDAVLLEEPGR